MRSEILVYSWLIRRLDGDVNTRVDKNSITRSTVMDPKLFCLKSRAERGRRRASWVETLYLDLRYEFDRLSKLCVKFNLTTVRHLALEVLNNSSSTAYNRNMFDPISDISLHKKIYARLIQ